MALRDCRCGCETPTRAQFAPGHDSRFVSDQVQKTWLLSQSSNESAMQEIRAAVAEVSEKLLAKYDRSWTARQAKPGSARVPFTEREGYRSRARKRQLAGAERAEALQRMLAAQYWTGQEGQVTMAVSRGRSVLVPAKVMKRHPDDHLTVRVTWPNGRREDVDVQKSQFSRNGVDDDGR